MVEELFKARLLKLLLPHQVTNTDIVPSLVELERRLKNSNNWYIQYILGFMVNEDEKVSITFNDRQKGLMTWQEILFHIINHAIYHRGSINHRIKQCNLTRPADMYTMFIYEIEPQRRT